MSQALQSMENILLEELTSTMETIWSSDARARESVESSQWMEAYELSAMLVDLLKSKRVTCESIRQRVIELHSTHTEQEEQIQRCVDMSTFLLNAISKYLAIYQRVLVALMDKLSGTRSPLG